MGVSVEEVEGGWCFRLGDDHHVYGDPASDFCHLEDATGTIRGLYGRSSFRDKLAVRSLAKKLLGHNPNWIRIRKNGKD